MLVPKEAAREAVKQFADIVAQQIPVQPRIDNLTIEELKLSSDKKKWNVVIGYDIVSKSLKDKPANSIEALLSKSRQFKTIIIDADNGSLISLEAR